MEWMQIGKMSILPLVGQKRKKETLQTLSSTESIKVSKFVGAQLAPKVELVGGIWDRNGMHLDNMRSLYPKEEEKSIWSNKIFDVVSWWGWRAMWKK